MEGSASVVIIMKGDGTRDLTIGGKCDVNTVGCCSRKAERLSSCRDM